MRSASPREQAESRNKDRHDREREERIRTREQDPSAVRVPGVTPWSPLPGLVDAQRAAHERAAALAQLERDISAQRFYVRQLQLVAQDTDVSHRAPYEAQSAAADAVLQQMEARATAMRRGAPL